MAALALRSSAGSPGAPTRRAIHPQAITGRGYPSAVAWSPDGGRLALSWGTRVSVIRSDTGETVAKSEERAGEWTSEIQWSPSGETLAAKDLNGQTRLLDAGTGRLRVRLRDTSFARKWSPDGDAFAAYTTANRVGIFDGLTGKERGVLETGRDAGYALAWNPQGNLLACPSRSGEVELWDPAACRLRATLQRPAGLPVPPEKKPNDGDILSQPWVTSSVAWNPRGDRLAATAQDRGVVIWDMATEKVSRVLLEPEGIPEDVSWEPTGKRLASTVRATREFTIDHKFWRNPGFSCWEVATGERRFVRTDHKRGVMDLQWSPLGPWIAATSVDDDWVTVWNAETRMVLRLSVYHPRPPDLLGRVLSAAWSPDGKKLAAVAQNGWVTVWEFGD